MADWRILFDEAGKIADLLADLIGNFLPPTNYALYLRANFITRIIICYGITFSAKYSQLRIATLIGI